MRLDLIRTHLLEFINKGFPARQLRRLAARDLLRGAAVGRQASNALTASLLEWSALESASVLERLESRREGLSETEAEERRQRDGLNEVDQDRPISAWMHLCTATAIPSTCCSPCWRPSPGLPRTSRPPW